MMSPSIEPIENHLLGMLPAEDQARMFPLLEPVTLTQGDVLCESGDCFEYVYFPTDSIVSPLYLMEEGGSAEIAVVGNDGMVGIALWTLAGVGPRQVIDLYAITLQFRDPIRS